MKIAFFTEGYWYGTVPSNHNNMRTDLAWMHLLNAEHFCIDGQLPTAVYDIGIIIIPKNKVDYNINSFKKCCRKIGIMQEGPNNYWTDYTLGDQIKYLGLLDSADFILCHNSIDIKYYKGILGLEKPIHIMPSVMVDDHLPTRKLKDDRKGAIIGGNMCSWYNGMVSLIVAKNYSAQVHAPSMGRKVNGESRIEGLVHLKYLQFNEWVNALNDFEVGVHLMPTVAAGTFSLNCAFLGIPCIGNELIDTQRICHPLLSVDVNDVEQAMDMCIKLKNNDIFYKACSEQTVTMYNEKFHSSVWKIKMKEVLESIIN